MFAKKLIDMKRSISNIEALASGESGGNDCYGRGSLYCNGGYYKYQIYSIK